MTIDAPDQPSRELAQLLAEARAGESDALDRIMPLVYERLRLLARRQLRRLRPGQTLQTTGLVHEAYLKMVDQTQVDWQDRNHFLCVAAVAMRQILVDYSRRRGAQKRGGDLQVVTLEDVASDGEASGVEILDLDRALQALAEVDERLCRLVELRFFAGLTVEETAAALGVSDRTVKREWRKARALLHREMSEGEPG